MRRVEILWVDSRTIFDGWTMLEDIEEIPSEQLVIHSVGYVFKEDDEMVVLVQSKGEDQVLGGIGIPRRAILTTTEF